ncbi:unnamed protein product [Closterium sp. NIES-53]
MEVARTSMIHAAAPNFLWPFAVRYAAHQLNLWPRVSLPETSPTRRSTGKVGDVSVFRVWGSCAFVRDTSADKLSSRTIPCVFLGFPPDRLFPYRTAPLPSPPLFLAPGPPSVDPLLPQGPATSSVSQVDPLPGTVPVEVAVDSRAARGAASGGAASRGAVSGGAEPGGAEPEGGEPGGAESEGAESGGAEPGAAEPGGTESRVWSLGVLSLRVRSLGVLSLGRTRLRSGAAGAGGSAAGGTGAGGAGAISLGGAGVTVGAGGIGAGGVGGAGARDPGAGDPGARGTGARGAGARGAGAGDPGVGGAGAGGTDAGGAGTGGTGAGDCGAVDTGAGGAGAGHPGAGGTRVGGGGARGARGGGTVAGDPGAGGAGAGGAGSGGTGAKGTVQWRPFFIPPPPSSMPPPDSSDSPLAAPSPYAEQIDSLTECHEPESRPASPVRTGRRVPHPRPPPIPGTLSFLSHAATPTVPHLLANVVTDPSFESTAASALVAELFDFAAACRLNYATSLVAESESDYPLSVWGECALGTDVLEDKHEDFECLAGAVPHLVAMLLAPEGDPDAPDIPTLRSYA